MQDMHFVACSDKSPGEVRTNETRAPGDKNSLKSHSAQIRSKQKFRKSLSIRFIKDAMTPASDA
jgi:hypothetical protein